MTDRQRCRKLSYLVRYDLAMGFASNRARLVLALVCLAALAAMFLSALDAAARYVEAMGAAGTASGFGPFDVLAYFFAGSDYYRIDDKTPFVLPIAWMMQQILVAVLVGSYAIRDLSGQAPQVLMRVGGRREWWLSKCLWAVATVLAFYALEAVVAVVAAVAFGGASPMGDAVSIAVLGFPLSAFDGGELALSLLLPVALSLSLALAQVALSLVAGPFMSFVAIMSFLAVSVYFGSPFLIGDCSMLARSGFVQPGGVDAAPTLAACALVCAASVAFGAYAFSRKDLTGRVD